MPAMEIDVRIEVAPVLRGWGFCFSRIRRACSRGCAAGEKGERRRQRAYSKNIYGANHLGHFDSCVDGVNRGIEKYRRYCNSAKRLRIDTLPDDDKRRAPANIC
jgi:hypothetical protein